MRAAVALSAGYLNKCLLKPRAAASNFRSGLVYERCDDAATVLATRACLNAAKMLPKQAAAQMLVCVINASSSFFLPHLTRRSRSLPVLVIVWYLSLQAVPARANLRET